MKTRTWHMSAPLILFILLMIAAASHAAPSAAAPYVPTRAASAIPSQTPASLDRSTIDLVGSLPGNATSVAVQGTRAYIGNAENLRIVDVADPAHPAVLGSYPAPVADMQIVGNLAYIASGSRLEIVDVSDPSRPAKQGTFELPATVMDWPPQPDVSTFARRLQVVGDRAYVTNLHFFWGLPPYQSELDIIDVGNPISPTLQSRYSLGPSFNDLQIVNGLAYIGGATDIGGTRRFFADYLTILDIQPPQPVERATYRGQCPTLIGCVAGMEGSLAVVSNTAYLGFYGRGGLEIIDVSDPLSPTLRSTYPITVTDLQVVGHNAYIAAGSAGLQVLDVSDPLTPTLLAEFDTPGSAYAVEVRGDLLYIADGDAGLQIARFTQRATATIGSGGGLLDSPGDSTRYTFPPGAFAAPVVVTHTLRLPQYISSPGNLVGIGHAFEVTATGSLTGQPAQPTKPYTVTVQYTDGERGSAIESTLALYFWDGERWVKEPTSQVDTTANTITAAPNHFSMWAVLGETHRVFLPFVRQESTVPS